MAHGMNGGSGRLARTIKKIGAIVLAAAGWLSVTLGLVGGTLAAGTEIGDGIRWALALPNNHNITGLIVIVLLIVGLVISVIDIASDGIPNQWVVITAMAAPSVSSAFPTGLGSWITGIGRNLTHWVSGWLNHAVGSQTPLAVALGCLIAAGIISLALMPKSGTASRVVVRG